jgi:hypothetical protein
MNYRNIKHILLWKENYTTCTLYKKERRRPEVETEWVSMEGFVFILVIIYF